MALVPEWFDAWFEKRFVRRTYSALELAELLEVGLETVYRHIREFQDDEADGAMRVPREVVMKWLIERNALNL